MDAIRLIWVSLAVKQRNLIFKYWNTRNKSTAYSKKLNLKIKLQINLLPNNPKLGKKINFKNYRAIIVDQYSIIYLLKTNEIIIMTIWDNRQNPKRLLNILKEDS